MLCSDIMFRPQVLVDGGGGDWVILVSVKDARLNLQSWWAGQLTAYKYSCDIHVVFVIVLVDSTHV